jgi:hypothetical protein
MCKESKSKFYYVRAGDMMRNVKRLEKLVVKFFIFPAPYQIVHI